LGQVWDRFLLWICIEDVRPYRRRPISERLEWFVWSNHEVLERSGQLFVQIDLYGHRGAGDHLDWFARSILAWPSGAFRRCGKCYQIPSDWNLWKRYSGIPETFNIMSSTWDSFYLDVGAQILKDLTCRTKVPCGLANIANLLTGTHEDRMESFALSESLKYPYLLFDEDNLFNHDFCNFIFTTEGHMLFLNLTYLCKSPSIDHRSSISVPRISSVPRPARFVQTEMRPASNHTRDSLPPSLKDILQQSPSSLLNVMYFRSIHLFSPSTTPDFGFCLSSACDTTISGTCVWRWEASVDQSCWFSAAADHGFHLSWHFLWDQLIGVIAWLDCGWYIPLHLRQGMEI